METEDLHTVGAGCWMWLCCFLLASIVVKGVAASVKERGEGGVHAKEDYDCH